MKKNLKKNIVSKLSNFFISGVILLFINSCAYFKLKELENYDFINDTTMAYFKKRVDQATDDADFVLDYAIKNAKTRQEQESVCEALKFKTDVLWVMQDALYHSYINGHVPPGSFMPEDFNDRYTEDK